MRDARIRKVRILTGPQRAAAEAIGAVDDDLVILRTLDNGTFEAERICGDPVLYLIRCRSEP